MNEAVRLVEAGEYRSAISLLNEVLAVDSLVPEAYQRLAFSRLALNEPQAALRVADLGLRRYPGDVFLILSRADALVALGRHAEAKAIYKKLHDGIQDSNGGGQFKESLGRRISSLYQMDAATAFNAGDDATAEQRARQALTFVPDDIVSFRILTAVYVQRSDWEEADRTAARGLEVCGPDTSLLKMQAQARYETKNHAGLLQTAERLRTLLPGQTDAELLYADALFINEQLLEGIAVLEEMIRRRPREREAYRALAGIHRRRFDMKAAAGVLRREAEQFPRDPDVRLLLGETQELAEEWEEARKAYRAFGQITGDSIAASLLVARTFERQDSAIGAIREYRRILTWKDGQQDALLRLGRNFLGLGRWTDAIPVFQRLFQERPDAEVSTNLGWCLEQVGERDSARMHYERAIALRSDHPLPYYRLSVMMRDSSSARAFELAETSLWKALAKVEETQTALLAGVERQESGTIRDTREERRKYDEAGQLMETAFWYISSSFPEDEVSRMIGRIVEAHEASGRLHYLAGHFFRRTGSGEEALSHFTLATRYSPGFAPAHTELGKELEERGRNDEALLSFERALALEPERPDHYADVIRTTEKVGRFDDLAERWKARLQTERDNSALRNALVQVLHKIGRFEEAGRILGEAEK